MPKDDKTISALVAATLWFFAAQVVQALAMSRFTCAASTLTQ